MYNSTAPTDILPQVMLLVDVLPQMSQISTDGVACKLNS